MRSRTLYALTLALLITGPGIAYAKITMWQPPVGMAWDTPDKKCNPQRSGNPFIQACYYGKKESPEDHVGLAFFRKCGPYRQSAPFLVADFDKNEFTFNSDPSREDARIFTGELSAGGNIDPEEYLVQLPAVDGPCWPKQSDPS